jgi:hypothetical protein
MTLWNDSFLSFEMDALSASGLAELAGTTLEEVQRLVDLGILITDGAGLFRTSDVQKVRLLEACERAGLPVQGIAAAVGKGSLSFDFLEAAPYRRWAVRSARSYREVSRDTGIPLGALISALESMGFAKMAPDEPIREDELEDIVPCSNSRIPWGIWTRDRSNRPSLGGGPALGRYGRESGLHRPLRAAAELGHRPVGC